MTTTALSPRSQSEILAKYNEVATDDMFGFESSEYLGYLDYENAKASLKPETTAEQWAEAMPTLAPVEKMRDYMTFAFGKAWDCRGISANRSISHCIAWIWLSGDDEFYNEVKADYAMNYHGYGVPILRRVCEKYGWNASDFGDMDGLPRE